MISAGHPGEALAHLGQLGSLGSLGPLYPAPQPPGMSPEFLAPPPRPYARYPPRPRARDLPPPSAAPNFPPVPGAYTPPFLPHYPPHYLYRTRTPQPQQPIYPLRPRPSSGFVPPAPAPRSPPAPAPLPAPPEPPASPERAAPVPYFCRGALIRLEDGSLRRVEEMRTEDFVVSAERSGDLALTQCTLLRLEERHERLSLLLTYDRSRTQVELESTVDHPFFVYGRGWASFRPELTQHRYGLRVQRLQVGDVCVSLVARKHAGLSPVAPPISASVTAPAPAPPQTYPENLSVKEDARKRRWSAPEVCDEDMPPAKKR